LHSRDKLARELKEPGVCFPSPPGGMGSTVGAGKDCCGDQAAVKWVSPFYCGQDDLTADRIPMIFLRTG